MLSAPWLATSNAQRFSRCAGHGVEESLDAPHEIEVVIYLLGRGVVRVTIEEVQFANPGIDFVRRDRSNPELALSFSSSAALRPKLVAKPTRTREMVQSNLVVRVNIFFPPCRPGRLRPVQSFPAAASLAIGIALSRVAATRQLILRQKPQKCLEWHGDADDTGHFESYAARSSAASDPHGAW